MCVCVWSIDGGGRRTRGPPPPLSHTHKNRQTLHVHSSPRPRSKQRHANALKEARHALLKEIRGVDTRKVVSLDYEGNKRRVCVYKGLGLLL
jgi:hypothetical protein